MKHPILACGVLVAALGISATQLFQAPTTEALAPAPHLAVITQNSNPPEPKGGYEALYKYIATTMKYPAAARRTGVQGKVYVSFVVEADGKLSEIHVSKGIHPECDAEAVRVLQECPLEWQPGIKEGIAVRTRMSIPMSFKLNEPQETKASTIEEFEKPDETATPKEGYQGFYKYVQSTAVYPKDALEEGLAGKVYLTFIVEADGRLTDIKVSKGISESLDAEAVRVLKEYKDTWVPAKKDGKAIRSKMSIPIQFSNPDAPQKKQSLKEPPLLVVDGKIYKDFAELRNLNPNEIVSIDVLKGQEAIKRYGQDGKNGVVLIQLSKQANKVASSAVSVYPNPTVNVATFKFELQERSLVKLELINPEKQEVSLVKEAYFDKGTQEITWNNEQLPAGIYLLRLSYGKQVHHHRIVVQK